MKMILSLLYTTVVGAKAPRKQLGGASSSTSVFGSPGSKDKYSSGNPVRWTPTPSWQKGNLNGRADDSYLFLNEHKLTNPSFCSSVVVGIQKYTNSCCYKILVCIKKMSNHDPCFSKLLQMSISNCQI